jgi:hypothetical protein
MWLRIKTFHLSISSRPAMEPTQFPIQLVAGALSPGFKRLELEADHSSLASAEVKETSGYTSIPSYCFMS